jgi:hypothetical protein
MSKELKNKKFSERQKQEMTQYKEYSEHTQIIKLGKDVECRIRLQETLAPGKDIEIGIDIRKFLHDYPFRGGRQGILISKEKWLEFVEKIIGFTISIWGEEVFYTDEPQPEPIQQPQWMKKNVEQPPKKMANKPIEDTNFQRLATIGKNQKKKAPSQIDWIKNNL